MHSAANEETLKLYKEARQAGEVLFSATNKKPLSLFRDTITIDREKLSITYRTFFKTAKVVSTPLDDIEAVDADVGPFLGSLRITSSFFVNNTRYVRRLARKDAEVAQSILQGYKLAKEKDINLAKINKEELVLMLCQLGSEPR